MWVLCPAALGRRKQRQDAGTSLWTLRRSGESSSTWLALALVLHMADMLDVVEQTSPFLFPSLCSVQQQQGKREPVNEALEFF